MSGYEEGYDRLESIVAKLYVLRDSCTGIIHTEETNPNLIWFQGAEAMLQEAVDELQKVLPAFKRGEAVGPDVSDGADEEVPGESEEDQEEASSDDSE